MKSSKPAVASPREECGAMNTSKPAVKTSPREGCGVWLDTVDLKVKAQKKRLVRPISKLLNPLARHGGYSLAVALNFTQTKVQMPVTKQSSISSFFTPQHRVVNKASAAPNRDPADSSPSTPTGCTSASPLPTAGRKRRRGTDPDLSGPYRTEAKVFAPHNRPEREGGGCGWSTVSLRENASAVWREPAPIPHFHKEHGPEEEEEDEDEKREFSFASSAPEKTPPLGERWSQDQWSASSSPQCSQYVTEPDDQDYITQPSEGQCPVLTHQELLNVRPGNNPSPASPESLLSEGGFGVGLGAEGRTSTQRSASTPRMSPEGEGKENDPPPSSTSPIKSTPLCPLKCASHTPREHRWTEPSSTPPRKRILRRPIGEPEAEQDSQAVWFTQDSEGCRVMAHPGHSQSSWSPLKDQTNTGCSRAIRRTAYVAVEEEEVEEEMLFTQDSEGNLVIKH